MGFRVNRRIGAWTAGLHTWAQRQEARHGPGSEEALYALGVIIAVNEVRKRSTPLDMTGWEIRSQMGYADAKMLIKKVLESGNAPAGDYKDLLAMPYSEPL